MRSDPRIADKGQSPGRRENVAINAALTTVKVVCFQFSILRQAQGLPASARSPTLSDCESYPTSELQQPLNMTASAINLNLARLISPKPRAMVTRHHASFAATSALA